MLPIEYAIATITSPNARAVSRYPVPFSAEQPTTAAVPHAKNTRTNVPMNSATYFLIEFT